MSKIGRSFSFWNIFCRNSHWFERQNDTGLVSPGEELGLSVLSNANWFFFPPQNTLHMCRAVFMVSLGSITKIHIIRSLSPRSIDFVSDSYIGGPLCIL